MFCGSSCSFLAVKSIQILLENMIYLLVDGIRRSCRKRQIKYGEPKEVLSSSVQAHTHIWQTKMPAPFLFWFLDMAPRMSLQT